MRDKAVSFFCGAGGIDLGFHFAGFKTILASDFEPAVFKTFSLNFPDVPTQCIDIREFRTGSLGAYDIFLAGFPCTPFSTAGNMEAFNDEKAGDLFFEVLRILRDTRPQVLFLENVANLVRIEDGVPFKKIQDELALLGYRIKHKVYNSRYYGGTIQNRERVFIVGFQDKELCDKFTFPESQVPSGTISDFVDLSVKQDDKYYIKPSHRNYDEIVPIFDGDSDIWMVQKYRSHTIRTFDSKKGFTLALLASCSMFEDLPFVKDAYGVRALTPRECFRLQKFPDPFKLPVGMDAKLYKQAGNSVTVTVVYRIAREIYKVLNGGYYG